MSEKEWEREKAVNLYLHLMKIYVQSVGVCVSLGDPPLLPPHPAQPAPLTPTGKCQSLSQERKHLCNPVLPLERPLGRG